MTARELQREGEGVAVLAAAPARPLRVAVPKGSLNPDSIAALQRAGLDTTGLEHPGRLLRISNPGVEYIIVRPSDAPVMVSLGAADCGICGKDSLIEADVDVVELVDLTFGACRFVVAEPALATGVAEERYCARTTWSLLMRCAHQRRVSLPMCARFARIRAWRSWRRT